MKKFILFILLFVCYAANAQILKFKKKAVFEDSAAMQVISFPDGSCMSSAASTDTIKTSEIFNDSSVPGTKLNNALDNLKLQVSGVDSVKYADTSGFALSSNIIAGNGIVNNSGSFDLGGELNTDIVFLGAGFNTKLDGTNLKITEAYSDEFYTNLTFNSLKWYARNDLNEYLFTISRNYFNNSLNFTSSKSSFKINVAGSVLCDTLRNNTRELVFDDVNGFGKRFVDNGGGGTNFIDEAGGGTNFMDNGGGGIHFIDNGTGGVYFEGSSLGGFYVDHDAYFNGNTTFDGSVYIESVLNLSPLSTAPSSPNEGAIYVNSVDHHIYCYLNGSWVQLDN